MENKGVFCTVCFRILMVIEDWWNLETGELYLSGFLLRWLQGKVYYFGQIFSLKTSSFFCSALLVVFHRILRVEKYLSPVVVSRFRCKE